MQTNPILLRRPGSHTVEIEFLPDRLSKAEFEITHPSAAKSLRARWSIMMDNSRELVAWVGIAHADTSGATVFLPHGSPSLTADRCMLAKPLMEAILRFARERGRGGDASNDEGLNQTALLADIAADYRDHGLYTHRERICTRNAGKPDWPRTIKNEPAFKGANGASVYSEFRGVRPSTFDTNLIALIQGEVVSEIASIHGWWLGEHFGAREMPVKAENIRWPKHVWPKLLLVARGNLYQTRAVRLVNLLLSYLEKEQHTGVGPVVCGIADFSAMWEEMLRKVLPDVEDTWNPLMPGPVYIDEEGRLAESGRMEMDIVVKRGRHILIADAKYYRATSVSLSPGWADIVKQLYYQKCLASIEKASDCDITNIFLFPAFKTERSPFRQIEMRAIDGREIGDFPPIGCQYISISDVLKAYSKRQLLDDTGWLDGFVDGHQVPQSGTVRANSPARKR